MSASSDRRPLHVARMRRRRRVTITRKGFASGAGCLMPRDCPASPRTQVRRIGTLKTRGPLHESRQTRTPSRSGGRFADNAESRTDVPGASRRWKGESAPRIVAGCGSRLVCRRFQSPENDVAFHQTEDSGVRQVVSISDRNSRPDRLPFQRSGANAGEPVRTACYRGSLRCKKTPFVSG